MSASGRQVREIAGSATGVLPDKVLRSEQPLVFRQLVSSWPLVQAARRSDDAANNYLRKFYNGSPVTVSVGSPEIDGRFFYNEDLSGFNFEMKRIQLDDFLDELERHRDERNPPAHYIGSTTVEYILPGMRDENDLAFGGINPLVSIWLGNQTCIAAHFDVPDNIACVAAGRRRFTLFPPHQLENLYVGPLDHAPAGQAISTVNVRKPDFDKHPKFQTALEHAQVVMLEPGDAIYIPSMWWHHVEGLAPFNALVNYWWRNTPAYMGNPSDVLNHALLSIRDLPAAQRDAWQNIFNHYVFKPEDDVTAHIPKDRRGILGPIDDLSARKLRALLLKQLNR